MGRNAPGRATAAQCCAGTGRRACGAAERKGVQADLCTGLVLGVKRIVLLSFSEITNFLKTFVNFAGLVRKRSR